MTDILEVIAERAPTLKPEDLAWMVPQVTKHYSSKLEYFSRQAYSLAGGDAGPLANAAFTERAKSELEVALDTFLFKKEHWKAGRVLHPYLVTTLKRLSGKIYQDINALQKQSVPICPLCKEENRKEFLTQEGKKLWRCTACTSAENNSAAKIFALHSKIGFRCPSCTKFVPQSACSELFNLCPYPGCHYEGVFDERMTHPATVCARQHVSLQASRGGSSDRFDANLTLEGLLETKDISSDMRMEVTQRIEIEYDTLIQVIDEQIEALKRTNLSATLVQKTLMYEAFRALTKSMPEEMISYLVHQKQTSEFPIQARIFQEYVNLIENYLPFTMIKSGAQIDIVDLADPHLNLFLGISKYSAKILSNSTIPNLTKEGYVGGRKFKNYGPCFLGKLLDVTDESTGKSLRSQVISYNFAEIHMHSHVPAGTPVLVTHYRIPSHYEMGSLVFLQRVRRDLVDSIYFRLFKKKRVPQSKTGKTS